MRTAVLWAVLAVWSPVALAAGQELPDYAADKITERVYVIHGPLGIPNPQNQGFMNNPVIAIADAGVVIIDPGSSLYAGRMVLRQLKSLTDKPVTHVIGTHIHGDHWLGNHAIREVYPNARFYAHPKMIELANGGEAEAWINLMLRLTESATEGTEAVVPDQPLVDGQVLDVPGLTLKVHLTEHAHTLTDAMIEIEQESVMVLGDNALYERIGRMDDGHFTGNVAALERALAVGATHYVPGHGRSGGPEVASTYRDYLKAIYAAAVKYSEELLPAFEIKERIEQDFARYAQWSGFDEEFGKHISLAVLEAEQSSF
ncbi:MAG: MBL fold metallo-hydrolase [Gammaproteobacteria bacterium]|nr:MBL fold metallo-hydrolase [Gammaproteobacteria bacterium]